MEEKLHDEEAFEPADRSRRTAVSFQPVRTEVDELRAILARERRTIGHVKDWMRENGYKWDDVVEGRAADSTPRPSTEEAHARNAKSARERGDLETFFKEIAYFREKANLLSPGCAVHFKNVTVTTTEKTGEERIRTVGSIFTEPYHRLMHGPPRKVEKVLLDGASGVLKPGTITLVLGPPGAGKTVLMKALSGKLKHSNLNVSGDILYNGYSGDETDVFILPKTVGYIDQHDHHLPALTVRQTFQFAFDATYGVDNLDEGEGAFNKKLREEIGTKVDNVLRLLGLEGCADTVVGNALLRGVSGGQRKRVTTGEVLTSDFRVLFADEISTGLDAATTFDAITLLKMAAKVFNLTTVVSLLQPAPEVFELFDDVMLLDRGRIVYHGPRDEILPYFEDMGFHRPPLKDVADFLQEVTTADGQAYIDFNSASKPPRTSTEFLERWQASRPYQEMSAVLDRPMEKGSFPTSVQVEFANSWWQDFKLCLKRSATLQSADFTTLRTRLVQQVIVGALVAGLFANLAQDAFTSKYGVMFVAIMNFSLGSTLALPSMFEQRAVFYKQRDASFYRTSAYAVATTIIQLPQQAMEILIWVGIVYFSVELSDADGGRHFFIFLAVSFLTSVTMSQFFQILVASLPSVQVAQPVSAACIVVFVLFSGYVIAEDDIDPWFIWIYYLNPSAHAFLFFAQNEFLSSAYDEEFDLGGGETIRQGDLALENQGLSTDEDRSSIALFVLLAYAVIFSTIASFGFHVIRHDDPHSADGGDEDAGLALPAGKGRAVSPAEKSRALSPGPYTGKSFHEVVDKPTESKRGLPLVSTDLAWRDLSYSVDISKDDQLELLHEVSGYALHGTCTALMGSSGAGKTTLMDVIAGRKTGGHISGSVFVNGYELDRQSFARIIGYCEQMDIHMQTLTVFESLQFSARLRLQEDIADVDMDRYVEGIVDSLDLEHIRDLQVSSLAQEQAKRLTIGVELAANPSILFLDEPTSGLDARAAALVMKAVKQAANSGRAVVATIHQPSQAIFDQFDQLLLLKRGGRTVYFGELGDDGEAIVKYFTSIPGTIPYKSGTNPAVYMLDVIGAGTGASTLSNFDDIWYQDPRRLVLDEQLQREGLTEPGALAKVEFDSFYAASVRTQIRMCMWRATVSYYRSPQYNLTRLIIAAFVSLLFGAVYFQQDYSEFSAAYSRTSLVFMTALFIGIVCYVSSVNPFYELRAVFYRERAANMYRVYAYAMSIGVIEMPYLFATALVFTVVYYFTVGFQEEAGHFFEYFVFILLWIVLMTFYGQFLVSVFPTTASAMAVGSGLVQIFNLFAGFIQPVSEIPDQLVFFFWLSPLHYVFEGLLTSQFRDDDTNVQVLQPGVGTIEVKMSTFVNELFPDFDYDNTDYGVGVLIAFIIVFRIGTFLALTYVNHLKR
mmetsp:Transcript_19064/g.72080  ORF Transcript_19064/g.72080 Transcript_19064/m.72080 type:complete len:1408 (-) Transcript_19064:508-4731(-)